VWEALFTRFFIRSVKENDPPDCDTLFEQGKGLENPSYYHCKEHKRVMLVVLESFPSLSEADQPLLLHPVSPCGDD